MALSRVQIIAFFGILFLLYLLLIPAEHTADAYGYAAAMGRGEWWSPHHLLYQPSALLWAGFWSWTGLESIWLYSAWNSAALLVALMAIWQLLPPKPDRYLWVALVASSFVCLRFGTENETYAWPLALSLWGTERYLANKEGQSALLLTLAVLFHQMHVFWCLALLLYSLYTGVNRHIRWVLGMLMGALLVLAVYSQIAHELGLDVWYFITRDWQEGLVDRHWGFNAFALTIVNLFRSFLQIHASTLQLFNTPWVVLFVAAAIAIGTGLFVGIKPRFAGKAWLKLPFTWILIVHGLFALFSQGNAEFMMMVPPLLGLAWAWNYRRAAQWPIGVLVLGLFAWNGGTLLAHQWGTYGSQLQKSEQVLSHFSTDKQYVYVSINKVLLDNYLDYKKIRYSNLKIWKAPGYGTDAAALQDSMKTLTADVDLFIDQKSIQGKQTRADWLGADAYNAWVDQYEWEELQWVETQTPIYRWKRH